MTDRIYISKRLESRLEGILSSKITVLAANDGHGRTTCLNEFLRRRNIKAHYITQCDGAQDCWGKLCQLVVGKKLPLPINMQEFLIAKRAFSMSCYDRDTLIVMDNIYAERTILGGLYIAELLSLYLDAKLVFTSKPLSEDGEQLCNDMGFHVISDEYLLLNENETIEYAQLIGVSDISGKEAFDLFGGDIMSTRIWLTSKAEGLSCDTTDPEHLLRDYFLNTCNEQERIAIMLACAYFRIPKEFIADLQNEKALVEEYGSQTLSMEYIVEQMERFSARTGLLFIDRNTLSINSQPRFRNMLLKYFYQLPPYINHSIRHCLARQFLRFGNTFYAFCEFYLAGELEAAADVPHRTEVSLSMLLSTRSTLVDIVLSCPLEHKKMFPRILRILAMLMVTDAKEKVQHKFDEAVEYLQTTNTYTDRDRRAMLAYLYAMRTYESFFHLDKMGFYIKQAYEYFDGGAASVPPLHSWHLYTLSVMSLVHRYYIPLTTEKEQFVRWHSMYSDIVHHGKCINPLYISEADYFTGNIERATKKAEAVIKISTGHENAAAHINAVFLAAKLCLIKGDYKRYMELEKMLSDAIHAHFDHELGYMAALSYTELCMYCGDYKRDSYYLRRMDYTAISLNRFSAPFYFYVQGVMLYLCGEYDRMLEIGKMYFFSAEDVNNETIRIKLLLLYTDVLLKTGDTENAERAVNSAMETLDKTDIIAPAAEVMSLIPTLYENAKKLTPEKYHDYLSLAEEMARRFRRGAEVVATYKMAMQHQLIGDKEREDNERLADRHTAIQLKFGLSRKELAFATMAVAGVSNERIATVYDCSTDSVKGCLKRAYKKLGITKRSELKTIFPQ